MILLVNSGGEAAVPEWRAAFARVAPHLEVRWLLDPAVPREAVAYVLVWEPPHGVLATFPKLRLILSSAAGVDHLTADPALPRHLPIIRMGAAEAAQRMGEYVCLAALAMLRNLPQIIADQAAHRWHEFPTPRCAEQVTVGILGLGNLGARAARMLAGLGFGVIGWSRTPKAIAGVESHVGDAGGEEVFRRSDILVNLLPDTPQTRGLIGARRIALLPPGAAIVNAGRGAQLVMADLIAALDRGHLARAMLDVFETEPLPAGHPAWSHPKILVTSHIAASASRPARARFAAEAIAAWERGERLPTLYDPERGY